MKKTKPEAIDNGKSSTTRRRPTAQELWLAAKAEEEKHGGFSSYNDGYDDGDGDPYHNDLSGEVYK